MTRKWWWIGTIAASGMFLLAQRDIPAPACAIDLPENQPKVAKRDASPVRLRWITQRTDGTDASVVAEGLTKAEVEGLRRAPRSPEAWKAVLAVRVAGASRGRTRDELPALSGRYQLSETSLRFAPRYPLEPGMTYRAELNLEQVCPSIGESKAGPVVSAEFRVPNRVAGVMTRVTGVFPSSDVLPENLLRFYITFSAPMSQNEAYQHIRLLDQAGKALDLPFLELDEELWSRDGRRFTLLFDPGRIKRGLKPREELGPVLEAGRSYELVIDSGWKDANGQAIGSGFRKAFRVVEPDDRCPDPKGWKIESPRANWREPLVVRFPEPLDRALLDRMIAVQDASGRAVDGESSVADGETVWRIEPAAPWRVGSYRLIVGKTLEDVAGNSVGRPFEVDVFGPITAEVKGETVEVRFEVSE